MKSENKIPTEIVAYQADALELKNQKLPFIIRCCVWIPFLTLFAAIVWACWAEVDVVIQATGKLVTDKQTIVMKPLERSVIKSVHVKIGDVVKKDDILFTFDPTFNKAEAERLKNEQAMLEAELARLDAEAEKKDYTASGNQHEREQYAIFRQNRNFYDAKIAYFAEAQKRIDATIKSRTDTLEKQQERLNEFLKLEKEQRRLFESTSTALRDLIEITVSRMEIEANIDSLKNELLELPHRTASLKAEEEAFIQEWQKKISEDRVEVRRRLTAVVKDYDKVRQLLEYVELRSPCDAVVHELATFSPGSAVQEAEALITLVPLDGETEIECEIRPQDIGKAQVGSKARIKLSAYPFQKHGTLDGTIRMISENTHQKTEGALSATYYRARMGISGKLNNVPDNFRLIPGMEVQCEIKCDQRRVIEYVLYPLIKGLDEAIREP